MKTIHQWALRSLAFSGLISVTLFNSAPANAGNVHHVGPNQTFQYLQLAINASQDGDLIYVHPGRYYPIQIDNKSISILGFQGGKFEIRQYPGIPAIQVENLNSTQTVTIFDTQLKFTDDRSHLVEIHNNSGAVRLKHFEVSFPKSMPHHKKDSVISVRNTTTAWFADFSAISQQHGNTAPSTLSSILGNDALSIIRADQSQIIVQRGHIRGFDNDPRQASGNYAGEAVRLVNSEMFVTEGTYIGGGQARVGGHAFHRVESSPNASKAFGCGETIYGGGEGFSTHGKKLAINNDGRVYQGNSAFDPLVPFCLTSTFSKNLISSDRISVQGQERAEIWSNVAGPRPYDLFIGISHYHPSLGSTGIFDGRLAFDFIQPYLKVASGSAPSVTPLYYLQLPEMVGMGLTIQTVLKAPQTGIPSAQVSFSIPEMIVITD